MHIELSFIRHKAAVNPVVGTFCVGGQKKSIFNEVLGSQYSTSMLRSTSQKVWAIVGMYQKLLHHMTLIQIG